MKGGTQKAASKMASAARGNPPPGQRRTGATPQSSKMTGGSPATSARQGKK